MPTWVTPGQQALGTLITETIWDQDVVFNSKYLKGQYGTITLEAEVRIDKATSGDAFLSFYLATVAKWSVGCDDSDSDKFKLSASAALGTTDIITCTSASDYSIVFPQHGSLKIAVATAATPDFYYFGFSIDNCIGLDALTGAETTLYLGASGSMAFVIDTDNDQTDKTFVWGHNTAVGGGSVGTEIMRLDEAGMLRLTGNVQLVERSANPSAPTDGTQCNVYVKGNLFILHFNDGGTERWKYLDLTGTGVTWVHTAAAP